MQKSLAKKRFTDGLESLFEEPKEEKAVGKELLLFPEEKAATTKTKRKEKEKKNTGKDFTDNLQSFLQ